MTDNRDHANLQQQKKRKITTESYSNEWLACPFYRNSPEQHQNNRSCAGPGWATVHRVKEHIFRQHALPIHCVRCSALFTTETELNKHLTLPAPCSLRIPTSQLVGFNKEQEKSLRKRCRGPAEKQWKDVYKILFPLVSEELIPSPHYENSIEEWEKRRRRDLDQMESYLGLELPREVGRRLEKTSFQLPQALQNQIRRQVIEIVESAQADAFQSYRQQGTARPVETYDPNTSRQPPDSAQESQITYGCGLEATLEVPTFNTMTATTQDGASVSTAAVTMEPFNQASGLRCDFDSSIGSHDGLEQQNEGAGWMDSQNLDMSFINWNVERRI